MAIARVVAYHTTEFAVLTIVFPAMPLMFALGGSLRPRWTAPAYERWADDCGDCSLHCG